MGQGKSPAGAGRRRQSRRARLSGQGGRGGQGSVRGVAGNGPADRTGTDRDGFRADLRRARSGRPSPARLPLRRITHVREKACTTISNRTTKTLTPRTEAGCGRLRMLRAQMRRAAILVLAAVDGSLNLGTGNTDIAERMIVERVKLADGAAHLYVFRNLLADFHLLSSFFVRELNRHLLKI
ncbi:hypothetical protein EMEDMD4_440130 [Sinorhizobium medicae]|uniref:Uncharacterized protein n=1 Tax=Sinorhizobium medicae TaxID=110321 RepID=A0A508WZP4_9HYPH|nr:hypothetical protein EMEDMD4_440130 [Sinorhizobium medicae]